MLIMKKLVMAAVLLLGVCNIWSAFAEGRPFVTEWKLDGSKNIDIPIVGSYKLVIKNSSGTPVVTVEKQEGKYTFAPPMGDIYRVEAGPAGVEAINMGEASTDSQEGLRDVIDFGTVEWKTMNSAFKNCKYLNFAKDIKAPDLRQVTNMRLMFFNCFNFNCSLADWDVSKVTNMNSLFAGCGMFNQPLSTWNVSNVTTMREVFLDCSQFNQPLNWDVSKVTDMTRMFSGCAAFDQQLLWEVKNVIRMEQMFKGCSLFNQSLENWDVSNVTNMEQMFQSCSAFNQPLASWDVSKVTNMKHMFTGCGAFNQPLGKWKIQTAIGGISNTSMSTINYSNSLVDWAAQGTENIKFGSEVTSLTYNKVGHDAREILKGRGWTFEGDILVEKGVEIASKNLSLAVNEEQEITIDSWGLEATDVVTVTTEGDDAITITQPYNGNTIKIKGKTDGNVKLKAQISETIKSECNIAVKTVKVTSIQLSSSKKTLGFGESTTLKIDIQPANASNKEYEITAVSNPEGVATLDKNTLQVTAGNIQGKITITVTTKEPGSTVAPATCEIKVLPSYEVTLVKEGNGTISAEGYSETTFKVKKDTELTVIATPEDAVKYELKELKANGTDIKATMKFVVTADTKVTAVFGEKGGSPDPQAVEDVVFVSVVVAPNPFDSQLRIVNCELRGTYALLNAQGVMVTFGALESAETRINTSMLPAGMYLLRLTSESGATKTINVVKEK